MPVVLCLHADVDSAKRFPLVSGNAPVQESADKILL